MVTKLKEEDYINAAKELNVEVAVIKAVDQVESLGSGVLASGEPKILFEGHVFWERLEKKGIDPNKFVKGNENVLYSKWTKKYYLGGQQEHLRLQKAEKINKDIARESASWGRYQIMGYHWKSLGYSSLQEFINAMYKSEGEHLNAFVKFIKVNNLKDELQNKNWEGFARQYNGKSYKENKYDTKLAAAYKKFK